MNLLIFEYSSISEGMKICDELLTKFDAHLIKHDLRCPGRYACLLSGTPSNVDKMENHLKQSASLKCLTVRSIQNLDERILEMTNQPVSPQSGEDLLIVETKHVVEGYFILDKLIKTFVLGETAVLNRLGLFGKGVVIVAGKPQQIQSAYKMLKTPEFEKIVWQVEMITKPSFSKIRF